MPPFCWALRVNATRPRLLSLWRPTGFEPMISPGVFAQRYSVSGGSLGHTAIAGSHLNRVLLQFRV